MSSKLIIPPVAFILTLGVFAGLGGQEVTGYDADVTPDESDVQNATLDLEVFGVDTGIDIPNFIAPLSEIAANYGALLGEGGPVLQALFALNIVMLAVGFLKVLPTT